MSDRPRDEELLLVRRAKGGDRDAFGALYDRYVDHVFRYAFYRVRPAEDAEDVTSETFRRALTAMPRFEPRRPFLAFLYRIARNVIVDRARRERPRASFEDAIEHPSDEVSPDDAALASDEALRLRAAIQKLTPLQQEIIVLRFIEGLSYEEVAAATGKNESTIRGIQMRALAALRDLLPTVGVTA